MSSITVARVDIAVTHPLRQRVLRPGMPRESVHLPADDDPATAAFAARTAAGQVVGTAVVCPEPCPWLPQRHWSGSEASPQRHRSGSKASPDWPGAWRLRGMATDERLRGQGIGARVLRAALDHVAAAGGALVWCNARVPAERFYQRAGFRTHGSPWDDPVIGPHIAMWLELASP